jgi:hypothetical protein
MGISASIKKVVGGSQGAEGMLTQGIQELLPVQSEGYCFLEHVLVEPHVDIRGPAPCPIFLFFAVGPRGRTSVLVLSHLDVLSFPRPELLIPRVVLNIGNGVACLRVDNEDLGNQVLHTGREEGRDRVAPRQDFVVEFGNVGVLEREVPADHGIQNDSHAPDISSWASVGKSADHFRAGIARGATGCRQECTSFVGVGQTKIDDFHAPTPGGAFRGLQQQIFWF